MPTPPSLTFQLGGLAQGSMPDWATIIEIQTREQAKAKEEEEQPHRLYTMSDHSDPDADYDTRLWKRLLSSKRKVYDLLEAGEIEAAKMGNKYLVTEADVRDYITRSKAMTKRSLKVA